MGNRLGVDWAVTLLCCAISGIALVLGMLIAASPLSIAPGTGMAALVVLAEAR